MEGMVGYMNDLFARFYEGKRVLVTGHTGFKGSWLTEWLLLMGAKVIGLALPPATEPALFNQLGLAARCDHRIGDIRDRDLVHRTLHEVRPDVVFHLAAQPLVRLSYAQPLETYATNVMGTAHVLDALRDADWPCAAVMITTDKVYENKEWLHAYRESDPLGGYDPYSSSKACAELVIQSYRQSFFNPIHGGLRVAVASARAGNVIGGGDWAQDRIVPDCMRALAKGGVIPVRNAHATRPWQHVLEPLSGYLLLGMKLYDALVAQILFRVPSCEARDRKSEAEHHASDARLRTQDLTLICSPFNFGPPLASNRSVGDLVEEVLKHWPGRWEDRSDPRAPHEAGKLNLSTDKAFHVLDWQSRWEFAQTISATVSWYKTVREKGCGIVPQLIREQIAAYSSQA